MESIKALIDRHLEEDDFTYYVDLIEEAGKHEIDKPDIAIEICNSLFQGISKSIVYRLDSDCNKKAFESKQIDQQLKEALNFLSMNDDIFEIDFSRRCVSLVLSIAALRNARGDISHGRATPKELQSDKCLARLVLNISASLLRYMLASYFTICELPKPALAYEDNPDFNDQLDLFNPLEGKPLYSRALYDQYHEDYIIQLNEYKDSLEEPA